MNQPHARDERSGRPWRTQTGRIDRRQACAAIGAGLLWALGSCKKEDASLEEESRQLGVAELHSRVAPMDALGHERSLPIPLRDDDRAEVAFFYYEARPDPAAGLLYFRPDRLRCYSLAGVLLADGPLDSSFFRHRLPEGQILGTHVIPAGYTQDTFRDLQQALFRNVDTLIPSFAAGRAPERALATHVLAQMRIAGEKELLPLYEQIGEIFFAWLRNG